MVTLIAGPPCSGKSTLAKRLAQPGDVVLDFDDICVELGSTHQWAHSQPVREQAEYLMWQRMRQVRGVSGYVIRTVPRARDREQLAQLLGASVVWVLDPGYAECVRRARARPRGTVKGIRYWYSRYEPSSVDVPCPHVEARHVDPLITSRDW
jgi:predicted kinase